MANETKTVILTVHKELTDGYWNTDDALKFTSMLFAFFKPEQKVRDALKSLSCKKDKDERYRKGQSALEAGRDFHNAFREIEYFLEKYESRYRKRSSESEGRDARDMAMMVMPAIMSQRGTVSVSLDVNAFTETIYKECETCPIREVCKESFIVCTEYVSTALQSIEIPETKNE